jgi:tetratricopeptide (TPR) repeat protein
VAEERLLVLPWQQVLAAALFVVLLGLLLGPRLSLPLRGRRRASSDGVLRSHVAKYQEHQAAETAPARSLDAAPGGAVSPEQAPPDPVAVSSEPADPSAGRLTSSGQGSELAPLELLRQGREAARAGDRLVAYRLFVQVLELDPDSEEAWLWRAGTAEQPDEMVRCLTRVLEINPDNPRARRGLAEVQERLAGRVQESA